MSEGNAFLRASIEKSIQELPALPPVVTRILKETESVESCTHKIEQLLLSEQALASKVLRVVNSPYYGLSGRVSSVGQAIVVLGFQQIRNLVLSVCAFSMMKPKSPRQQLTMKQFWQHSFGTAAASRLIAERKSISAADIDLLFLAGLLHDIGRLFLFSNFTQTYDRVLQFAETRSISIEDAERKLLGLDHGAVGSAMAELWNLPKVLVSLIAMHESPPEDPIDPLLYIIHVADWSTKHQYEESPAELPPLPDHVSQWLNFTEEDFAWLREETDKCLADAQDCLGLAS